MDNDYYVFDYTKKQLEKKFSKKILDKFLPELAFLYQNGYELNCEEDEVDEQLSLFNYFKNESDFDDLVSICRSDHSYNKKIVAEEFFQILKSCSFVNKEEKSPALIKSHTIIQWNNIINYVNKIDYIISCNDLDIKKTVKEISNLSKINESLENVKNAISKELKVLTWIKFSMLIKEVHSAYIQLSKQRMNRNIALSGNINTELYGGIGGYDSKTKEIKCIFGSAISDLKMCKASSVKTKQIAKIILKEDVPEDGDDEEIKHLILWDKGESNDEERAKRAVITSSLYGIISLLCLKYDFNFLKEDVNSYKADKIYDELNSILKYCNITGADIN